MWRGAAVIARLSLHLGAREILVHEQGIRDGLLLSMIDERLPRWRDTDAGDRLEWVKRFAQRRGANELHAAHVADLACQVFDELERNSKRPGRGRPRPPGRRGPPASRATGYLIGHSKHHKHAYHLIMHADLPGFSAREVEIIANVARYHRRAHPRKKATAEFPARLEPADRRKVRTLKAATDSLLAWIEPTHGR